MGTSDGIRTEDWDVVHELAVEIVNANDAAKDRYKLQLLAYLDRLESQYGPLPSILATRADYLESDDPSREKLLLQAHSVAETRNDGSNLLYSAQSLAELFLERKSLTEADRWLSQMKDYLDRFGHNDVDYSEYQILRAEYRKLAIKRADLVDE